MRAGVRMCVCSVQMYLRDAAPRIRSENQHTHTRVNGCEGGKGGTCDCVCGCACVSVR